MSQRVLLNTTRVGTIVHVAGSIYDSVRSAWELPGIEEAGGKLVDPTTEILAAAELTIKLHEQGAATDLLDTIMIVQAQRAGTLDYDDTLTAPPLGARTIQQAIDILKASSGPTAGALISCDVSALSDGYFGYAISNETLAKTDAASVVSGTFMGAHVGIAGKALVAGIVQNARYCSTCATPTVNSPAFLARADAEPLGGAAGKLDIQGPTSGVAAEVGVVLGVDPVTFPVTRVARVVLQPKALLIRG
jgi:hypothetical protein